MHHISPGKYKTIWLVSMCSIISKHTYFLLKVDLHCNLQHFRNVSNTSGETLEINKKTEEHKDVIWGRAGGYDLIPMYRDPIGSNNLIIQ